MSSPKGITWQFVRFIFCFSKHTWSCKLSACRIYGDFHLPITHFKRSLLFLQKEVSRLRGIAHGGAESLVNDSPTVSFPGSPGSIKWEGLHESFSPLISDKRMSQVNIILVLWFIRRHLVYTYCLPIYLFHCSYQKKDYELALVGAFRREKEKDISLHALVAENQAALQLVFP